MTILFPSFPCLFLPSILRISHFCLFVFVFWLSKFVFLNCFKLLVYGVSHSKRNTTEGSMSAKCIKELNELVPAVCPELDKPIWKTQRQIKTHAVNLKNSLIVKDTLPLVPLKTLLLVSNVSLILATFWKQIRKSSFDNVFTVYDQNSECCCWLPCSWKVGSWKHHSVSSLISFPGFGNFWLLHKVSASVRGKCFELT